MRARILHTVDRHIAGARISKGSNSLSAKKTTRVSRVFPENSIFDELRQNGIHAGVLGDIYALFDDFGFRDTPSVGERIQWHAKSKGESIYDQLRKVNLYDHSVRVAKNALYDESSSLEQRAMTALFGLLHDVGKSKEACRHYGVPFGDGHEVAGAKLIRSILADTPYERAGEFFSEDLRRLALSKKEGEYADLSLYGEGMHRADALAREQELRIIRRQERDKEEI